MTKELEDVLRAARTLSRPEKEELVHAIEQDISAVPANALAVIDGLRMNGARDRSDCHQAFWEIVGELKSRWRRVSLADCFAIALAVQSEGTVLTCDHHGLTVLPKREFVQCCLCASVSWSG